MTAQGPHDHSSIVSTIRERAAADQYRVTQHAAAEMVEHGFTLADVSHALANAVLIENYPDHRRGACCLVAGSTELNRPLHVVCTSGNPVLIIVTVYEPKPPKWLSPTQRRPAP